MIKNFGKAAVLGAALFAAVITGAQAGDAENLKGVWRMTKLELTPPGQDPFTVPYGGYVIFSEAGTMSVQSQSPDPKAPGTPYSNAGYEAYFGDYTTNDGGTFKVKINQAAKRELAGQEFSRGFEVEGDTLILSPTNDQEIWKAYYERY